MGLFDDPKAFAQLQHDWAVSHPFDAETALEDPIVAKRLLPREQYPVETFKDAEYRLFFSRNPYFAVEYIKKNKELMHPLYLEACEICRQVNENGKAIKYWKVSCSHLPKDILTTKNSDLPVEESEEINQRLDFLDTKLNDYRGNACNGVRALKAVVNSRNEELKKPKIYFKAVFFGDDEFIDLS